MCWKAQVLAHACGGNSGLTRDWVNDTTLVLHAPKEMLLRRGPRNRLLPGSYTIFRVHSAGTPGKQKTVSCGWWFSCFVDMVVGDPPKLTVRYRGDTLDARQVDGKIWFAVDGQAVLTREQHLERAIPPEFKPVSTSPTSRAYEDSHATVRPWQHRRLSSFRCLQPDSCIALAA